jgi:hypothetical protein
MTKGANGFIRAFFRPPAFNFSVSVQKRGFWVEIKACAKFYRRHMVDMPMMEFSA